jgi:hypothetical protein
MHIGKLMARLNPKNVRFDVGSGGIPELTSTDIAAALGMVPAGLGRELLCMVWWPAGASLTAGDLARILSDAQRGEWRAREEYMLDATLAVAIHTGADSLRAAQRKYAAAHAERWPRWIVDAELGTLNAGYERVRHAILAEAVCPGKCPTCGGRGVISAAGLLAACRQCTGTGNRRISDAWRAEALNITEGGYRHTWRPVYEWTFELCADAIRTATAAMDRATA